MSRWLPSLDSASGAFEMPLWMAGALAALFVVVCVIALTREGPSAPMRNLVRAVVVVIAGLMIFALVQRPSGPDGASIESRILALNTHVMAPASPLACLAASPGEAVEAACERLLFANPETAAAAVSFVEAQVALVTDAASLGQSGPENSVLAGLRRSVEADRYGVVAHVFATRRGCANEQCPGFAVLRDPNRVRANLKVQKFDTTVRRHAAAWPSVSGPALAGVPLSQEPVISAANGPMTAQPQQQAPLANIDLPSASSIPPVSIMNSEPSVPAAPAAPQASPVPAPAKTAQPSPRRSAPATNGGSQNASAGVPYPMPLQIAPSVPQQ